MFKVLLQNKLDPEAEAALLQVAEVLGPIAGPQPLAGIETADAVLVGPALRCDAALFKRAARLKVVARTGIGYDSVDVAAATAAGVCVLNTPDAPTESTAEFAITVLLALARKLGLAERRFRTEGWIPSVELLGVDLAGKTLGLVGLGRIGTRVAEIARAFRMRVIACDPLLTPEIVQKRGAEWAADLPTLLSRSDIVSLHLPLLPETRGLLGAREFALMKPGALLINVARGPILVQSALVAALQSGHLKGAAIDVWDPEPAAADNPLLKLTNVVVTPHIAAGTVEGRRRSHVAAVRDTVAALQGQPPASLVNPEVWEGRRR